MGLSQGDSWVALTRQTIRCLSNVLRRDSYRENSQASWQVYLAFNNLAYFLFFSILPASKTAVPLPQCVYLTRTGKDLVEIASEVRSTEYVLRILGQFVGEKRR